MQRRNPNPNLFNGFATEKKLKKVKMCPAGKAPSNILAPSYLQPKA